jgi:hypothetical protein
VTVKGSPDYSVRPPNNVDVTTNDDVIQSVPVGIVSLTYTSKHQFTCLIMILLFR